MRTLSETDPLVPSKARDDGNNNDDDDDDGSVATTATMLQRRFSIMMTSVSDVVEQVQEAAADVVDNIAEEIADVQDAFMDELHEADDGQSFFTDGALLRNLSVLPSDVVQAAQAVHDNAVAHQQQLDKELYDEQQDTEEQRLKLDDDDYSYVTSTTIKTTATILKTPLSAYLGLASAVVSLSSIGPLLALQQDVTGTMKILWRMGGTAILLTPLAMRELYRTGVPRMTLAQWMTFLLATISYDIMGIAFVMALPYTSVGNAVILANSQAVILLAGNLFVGAPVTILEGAGAVIAFVGAILCATDSSSNDYANAAAAAATDKDEWWLAVWGDFLALVAGLGGCGYLIFAKTVRQHMGLYLYTFLTMFVGCLLCLVLQIFILRETVTFDRNPATGTFGFMTLHPDRLPLELVMVVVCNICGTMGYVRAMAFFDTLIISVAGLMEPVIAVFVALLMNVGVLPGWLGWVGNLFVAAGTLAVVYPTPSKTAPSSH